ncbi:MAG: aspartate kinase, partial [Promethearchaeota archaeon]
LVDQDAFNRILEITELFSDVKKVYVISAFKGITDLLLVTAQNVNDAKILDKNMAIIEKRHFDIIEQIFEEDSKYYNSTKKWIDEKLSELEDIFEDIREFGLEPYYQDLVLSFGEILSTYITNQFLLSNDHDSMFIPANQIIITNDEFNNAYPIYKLTNARVAKFLLPLLEIPEKNTIACVTGFIGRNKIGYTTTLGRGGSDYTATILARSLHEVGNDKDVKVILWKDVDGIMAINPLYAKESSLIRNLNYDEAKHIANFGAKILHPKCLEAIESDNIPLEIRNFEKPREQFNYTRISNISDKDQIKGISAEENAVIITVSSGSLVDVPGVLARIFKALSKNNISVSLVAQSASEINTSFVIKKSDADKAIKALKNIDFFSEFFTLTHEEVGIINITGAKVLDNDTKVKIFKALGEKNIHVKAISQSTEELNLSLVIDKNQVMSAIKIIHEFLYENLKSE